MVSCGQEAFGAKQLAEAFVPNYSQGKPQACDLRSGKALADQKCQNLLRRSRRVLRRYLVGAPGCIDRRSGGHTTSYFSTWPPRFRDIATSSSLKGEGFLQVAMFKRAFHPLDRTFARAQCCRCFAPFRGRGGHLLDDGLCFGKGEAEEFGY